MLLLLSLPQSFLHHQEQSQKRLAGRMIWTAKALIPKPLAGRDSWSLTRCNPLAAAAFTASRLVWSLRQKSIDAGEGSGKLLDKITASMDGDDGGGSVYE